jgi:biopolymer transport protein ExbB/TolQ
MILRTILFFMVMYFLVKIISRLFLPSSGNKQNRKGANFFYRNFQDFSQQANQQNQRNNRTNNSGSQQFEEIEEAEYEEITDEEESATKSAD